MSKSRMIPAQELDSQHVFQGVYYERESIEALDPDAFSMLSQAVKENIAGMAKIKNDPAYCRFLSDELGYNFFQSFEMLEKTPLILSAQQMGGAGEFYVLPPPHQHAAYSGVININPASLAPGQEKNLSFIIGHELGHSLIRAAEVSKHDGDLIKSLSAMPQTKRGRMNEAWQHEFTADKLACAIRPDDNRYDPAPTKKTPRLLTRAYREDRLPESLTPAIALFCKTRDALLAPMVNTLAGPSRSGLRSYAMSFLKAQDVQPTLTHPPDITRAVESDQFAEKARNFLKNTGP